MTHTHTHNIYIYTIIHICICINHIKHHNPQHWTSNMSTTWPGSPPLHPSTFRPSGCADLDQSTAPLLRVSRGRCGADESAAATGWTTCGVSLHLRLHRSKLWRKLHILSPGFRSTFRDFQRCWGIDITRPKQPGVDAVHHQAFASSELEAAAQQVSLLGGHTRRVQTLVTCHNGTVGCGGVPYIEVPEWMVLNGQSYSKWMVWGYPHFRTMWSYVGLVGLFFSRCDVRFSALFRMGWWWSIWRFLILVVFVYLNHPWSSMLVWANIPNVRK